MIQHFKEIKTHTLKSRSLNRKPSSITLEIIDVCLLELHFCFAFMLNWWKRNFFFFTFHQTGKSNLRHIKEILTLYYFEVELELLTGKSEVYNKKIILKTWPNFDFQKTRPHTLTSDIALQSQNFFSNNY